MEAEEHDLNKYKEKVNDFGDQLPVFALVP